LLTTAPRAPVGFDVRRHMQRQFFATADDLLQVFERVEGKRHLAYTLTGLFPSPELTTVYSGATIATLRKPAPDPSATSGYTYLVTDSERRIAVRTVPQQAGGLRYAVDQLENPDSITLTPGGIYPPNVLLYGRVGTVSAASFSVDLHRAFATTIGKLFQRVKAFHVGPGAFKLWQSGHRLTIGANSPPIYDLSASQTTDAV